MAGRSECEVWAGAGSAWRSISPTGHFRLSPYGSMKNLEPNKNNMNTEIEIYNGQQTPEDRKICDLLASTIDSALRGAENKVWHGHPVWFLDGNPIVGYSKQKAGLRLMFWSGADFEEEKLNVVGGKFKDASVFYKSVDEVVVKDLKRWLKKSKDVQWDYKNIVKRKGKLEKVKLD